MIAAVFATVLIGPGVGHAMRGRDRAAAIWIGAAAAALVGAALIPELFYAGLALRAPCAVELWIAGRRAPGRSPLAALVVATAIKVAATGAVMAVWLDTWMVSSESMAPTLEVGDRVFALEGAYWLRGPEVGDVVAFETRCEPGRTYIKRVVATGGDRVELRCGVLYLNDTAVTEARWTDRATRRRLDFPVRTAFPPCRGVTPPGRFVPSDGGPVDCPRQGQLEVPAGHLFVLGDNLGNSRDSRHWGPIGVDRVRGRVTGIWWPIARIGSVGAAEYRAPGDRQTSPQ